MQQPALESIADTEFNDKPEYLVALQHVLDAFPFPATYKDTNLVYCAFNKAFEEYSGKKGADIIGKKLSSLIMDNSVEAFHLADIELFATHSKQTFEAELFFKNRKYIFQCQKVPYVSSSGEFSGVITILLDITEQKQAELKLSRIVQQSVQAMSHLAELRDPYTAGHQRQVAQLAVAIGRKMNLSTNRLQGLYIAGLLHDIGKITIPAEILTKPGRLSTIEFQLIMTHSHAGYMILSKIDFPWPVAEIVLQHHERLDGSGYPNGICKPMLQSRILAVADVADAMIAHRPYRAALGAEKAIEELLRCRGFAFDAEIVDICCEILSSKTIPQFEAVNFF